MKILMFDAAYPPPIVGGKEKQAHLLAKALSKKGFEVKVLSYKHNINSVGFFEGIKIERFNRGWQSLSLLFLSLYKNKNNFSILHIHTPSRIGRIMFLFGKALGYKVVFKFPNESILDNTTFIDGLMWQTLFNTNSLFVCLEDKTEKKLELHGLQRNKIFRVSNGVEMREKKIVAKEDKAFNILFVGRLVAQKCCDQLILACKILYQKGLDFSLKVVGDGPLLSNIKELTTELGLKEHVNFEGHQSDTLSYMKSADVLVLPSEKEGMSNVLLEAISIGLPIVATDVGSARYQLGSIGEQFLCTPMDPDCLADKIFNLLNDFKLQCDYSEYIYERGHKLFSIDSISNVYIDKYKSFYECN